MTKHEAIEVLEEVKMLDDSMFAYSQAYNDALNMAIDALKAQDEKCRACGEKTNNVIQALQAELKSQEPRVMTLEEIQHTDAVWLETHGWKIQGGDIHETVLRRMSDFEDYVTEFADNDDGDITCDNSTLGIDWRCWSSEPTEEQREAIPWQNI